MTCCEAELQSEAVTPWPEVSLLTKSDLVMSKSTFLVAVIIRTVSKDC
jgi:hypothetical protein